MRNASPLDPIVSRAMPREEGDRFAALSAVDGPSLKVVSLRNGSSIRLRLGARRDGIETWLGEEGTSLTLDNGVVRATRGLGEGLLASDVSQTLALLRAGRQGSADRFHTYLTGDDRAVTRTFRCLIERAQQKETWMESGQGSSDVLQESCRSLDQSFVNVYRIREGKIVQSHQWLGEYIGTISIEAVEK